MEYTYNTNGTHIILTLKRSLGPLSACKFESICSEWICSSCGKYAFTNLWLIENEVFACGSSYYGQLGLGFSREIATTPTPVIALRDLQIAGISCGAFHSSVWTTG